MPIKHLFAASLAIKIGKVIRVSTFVLPATSEEAAEAEAHAWAHRFIEEDYGAAGRLICEIVAYNAVEIPASMMLEFLCIPGSEPLPDTSEAGSPE